jgi:hypothetical protein
LGAVSGRRRQGQGPPAARRRVGAQRNRHRGAAHQQGPRSRQRPLRSDRARRVGCTGSAELGECQTRVPRAHGGHAPGGGDTRRGSLRGCHSRTASALRLALIGGRYQTRTDDLFRVKEARYQLRQSPVPWRFSTCRGLTILADGTPSAHIDIGAAASTRAGIVTRWRRFEYRASDRLQFQGTQKCVRCGCGAVVAHHLAKVRVASSNLVIRSSMYRQPVDAWMWEPTHGGVAERRGSGLQSRIHGFESRRHLHDSHDRAIGAAVARFPDTEEVTGSIPVSPTTKPPDFRGFSHVRMPRPNAAERPTKVERVRFFSTLKGVTSG